MYLPVSYDSAYTTYVSMYVSESVSLKSLFVLVLMVY